MPPLSRAGTQARIRRVAVDEDPQPGEIAVLERGPHWEPTGVRGWYGQ
ncbi:MAG TPA: hypothetical protein QGH10_26295 [Armatimonadota bacterium]|nr:hypothetical protein [Armatimonadota bacterium]